MNSANLKRYTGPAILLHWVMGLSILGLIALGLYLEDLPPSPNKFKLLNWHKMIGCLIPLLWLLRVLWRLSHRPPPLADSMPKSQQLLSHIGHFILYVLMLAVPLSGLLYSQSMGFNVNLFGLGELPHLIEKDPELGAIFKSVHKWLNYTLIIMIIGHVAAAIKHHVIDKDGTLSRMKFGK